MSRTRRAHIRFDACERIELAAEDRECLLGARQCFENILCTGQLNSKYVEKVVLYTKPQ